MRYEVHRVAKGSKGRGEKVSASTALPENAKYVALYRNERNVDTKYEYVVRCSPEH